MKSPKFLLAAAALAFPLTILAAESGHHDHGAADAPQIQLNAGKKWTTDEPLRQGMMAIRNATATALPAAHSGKMTTAEYEAFGKYLGGQLGYIVENCKLDPKADAQLHIIVSDISSGMETVEGKLADKKRAAGVVKVVEALNTYGKYFDHAGWKSIKLPQH